MADAQSIERARRLLLEAALDRGRWPEALDAMAAACGGVSGQLIGLDGQGAVSAHVLTGVPEDFQQRVEAFGLSDRQVNPRLRLGLHAPVLKPVADQDHVDADERARHPIYAEMFEPHDVGFNCQAVVLREPDRLVRMSVSGRAPLEPRDMEAFAALAPYFQAAVRFQASLEAAWAEATLRTLDAARAAAILLDARGRVIGLSEEAERLVRAQEILRVRGGLLSAALEHEQAALDACIARALEAARAGAPTPGPPLRLGDREGRPGLTFEVQPFTAGPSALNGGPAVMLAARAPAEAADRAQTLCRVHRLSPAEAAVALRLADGESIAEIAETRGVTLETVRSQRQSIYEKMGVRREGQMIAAVRSLI